MVSKHSPVWGRLRNLVMASVCGFYVCRLAFYDARTLWAGNTRIVTETLLIAGEGAFAVLGLHFLLNVFFPVAQNRDK